MLGLGSVNPHCCKDVQTYLLSTIIVESNDDAREFNPGLLVKCTGPQALREDGGQEDVDYSEV